MGKPLHGPDDPAFRARAVELVRTSGLAKAQGARDLGINPETLRLWVKQTEIDTGQRDGLTTAEKAELARLRREVHGKTASFAADDSTDSWMKQTAAPLGMTLVGGMI